MCMGATLPSASAQDVCTTPIVGCKKKEGFALLHTCRYFRERLSSHRSIEMACNPMNAVDIDKIPLLHSFHYGVGTGIDGLIHL